MKDRIRFNNFFDDESLKGWQFVWGGHKRKKEHGVGILFAPHVEIQSYDVHLQARIISARVIINGVRLAILNVYSPTDVTKSDATKSAFYAALNKAKIELESQPKFKLITLRDFNATISSKSKDSGAWDAVLGHNNSDRVETNDNGERMLAWCLKNRLQIVNSRFRSKRVHRETWRHAATGKWKRVDYICTTDWLMKFVRSCRVYIGPSRCYDTDHRMVIMNIAFPCTKEQLRKQLHCTPKEPRPTTDVQVLHHCADTRKKLTEELDKELNNIDIINVDELNEKITITVKECVEKVCPAITRVKKKEPWEDESLQMMFNELRKSSNHEQMRKQQKAIKEKRRELKNEYYRKAADNINSAAAARQVEKEFSLAKKHSSFKTSTKLRISNEKLQSHFKQHFAARVLPVPPELENPENFPNLNDPQLEINESIPTGAEIKTVLKSFKNNRSSGTDKLKTEGLKYNDSKNLIHVLQTLLTIIWTTCTLPANWLHSSITCLYKKGKMGEAKNYRGLSIGANMSRILAKIIVLRIQDAYERIMGNEQFGFRRNRSTTDGIFILKTVIDKYGGDLIAIYIDLTAAYDHIPRDLLFRVLEMRTGAKHICAILRKMYEATTASIRGMKTDFEVLVGCRQGGQESPCLFNIYFDYVLKVAAQKIDEEFPDGWGIQFDFEISHFCTNREQRAHARMRGIEIIRWILYADDVVVFCKTVSEAQRLLSIINDTCKRFGLTVSFSKTKTQVFNNAELAESPSLFNVGVEVVENVRSFTYLGQVNTTAEKKSFTEHRTASATAKFNEMRNVLCDIRVNLRTRRKLLEACVRTRLTYGTQAWYPKEQEMKELEACWHELQRSMVRGGWGRKKAVNVDEEEFAFKYTNEDIQNILKTSSLRDTINEQYLSYIGHVCRMPNDSIPKKLLFAKPQKSHYRDPWIKMSDILGISPDQIKKSTQSRNGYFELLRQRFNSTSR